MPWALLAECLEVRLSLDVALIYKNPRAIKQLYRLKAASIRFSLSILFLIPWKQAIMLTSSKLPVFIIYIIVLPQAFPCSY